MPEAPDTPVVRGMSMARTMLWLWAVLMLALVGWATLSGRMAAWVGVLVLAVMWGVAAASELSYRKVVREEAERLSS